MSYLTIGDRRRLPQVVEECGRGSWHGLETCAIHLRAPESREIVLEIDLEPSAELLDRVEHCDAQTGEAPQGDWLRIPLRDLYHRVKLQPRIDTEEDSRRVLLDARALNPAQRRRLLDEATSLRGFRVLEWEVRLTPVTSGPSQDTRLLLLEALPGEYPEAPRALTGAPYVLVADVLGTNFLPLGREHPLLTDYPFFFPALNDNRARGWFPTAEDPSGYQICEIEELAPPVRLLDRLEVSGMEAESTPPRPSSLSEPFELQLRMGRDPRRKEDRSDYVRCIYRLDATGGDLGLSILSLLDHADVGLADAVYYGNELSGGPFGDVRHYMLIEPEIEESGTLLLPHAVYIQPRSFRECELPVFLREGFRFLPDLSRLLETDHLERDDAIVLRLREVLQLENPTTIALVDPGNPHPRVTLLTDGRQLSQHAQVLLENFQPDYYRRASHDLGRRRLATAEEEFGALFQLALADSAFVEDENQRHLEALERLCQELQEHQDRSEADLEHAGAFLERARTHLQEVPKKWRPYLREMVDLLVELGVLRASWYEAVKAEEEKLMTAQEALATLGRDLRGNARKSLKRLESSRDTLERIVKDVLGHDAQLRELETEVATVHENLSGVSRAFDAKANEFEKALRERNAELETRRQAAETKRQVLEAESRRLDDVEEDVVQAESANARESSKLTARDVDLQRRLRAASSERKRLEKVKDAKERVLAIRAEGVERHHEELTRKFNDERAEVERLGNLVEDMERKQKALAATRAKHKEQIVEERRLRRLAHRTEDRIRTQIEHLRRAREQREGLQQETEALESELDVLEESWLGGVWRRLLKMLRFGR